MAKREIDVIYANDPNENGWKLDYNYLAGIQDQLNAKYRWSCNIDLEDIEAVILILLKEFDPVDEIGQE